MDPTTLANGLASNPLAWFCAVLLIAIGFLARYVLTLHKIQLDRSDAANAAHRATLEKVIPIAEKLTSAVEILEKLSLREGQ